MLVKGRVRVENREPPWVRHSVILLPFTTRLPSSYHLPPITPHRRDRISRATIINYTSFISKIPFNMASSSAATFPSSPSVGLCPGYRHVEQFGPDEEYEDEVENFYVTLDLGAVEPTLIPNSSTYRLIVSHSNSERRQVKTQFFPCRD